MCFCWLEHPNIIDKFPHGISCCGNHHDAGDVLLMLVLNALDKGMVSCKHLESMVYIIGFGQSESEETG